MTSRDAWLLKIWDNDLPGIIGIGECAPLKGLSPELDENFEKTINCKLAEIFSVGSLFDNGILEGLEALPSLRFALECAILDLKNGGTKILFDTDFSKGRSTIDINGLVWMGNKERMIEELGQKIEQGYKCVKIKIGALDFREECGILEYLRNKLSEEIELRLDANGGFAYSEALEKLKVLSQYRIHSIEQPIKQGQWENMKILCERSPVRIALDEELIGINGKEKKNEMIAAIQPAFIILKPTLLGGLAATTEWIEIAEERGVGWWITSALESNIGLNAISQYASTFDLKSFPQGLGTGQLYYNNIGSSLVIESGSLRYDTTLKWDNI
jgi:o-succinylbenzoate synthase